MVHLRLIASTIALNLWTITGISLQLQPGGEDQSTESKLEESLANVDKKNTYNHPQRGSYFDENTCESANRQDAREQDAQFVSACNCRAS